MTQRSENKMLNILLVSPRKGVLVPFADTLRADPEVRLDWAETAAAALKTARERPPHLAVIDNELKDLEPLKLVPELLMVDARINTAVVSPLDDATFHEESEGLGVLVRLPPLPKRKEALSLLARVRDLPDSF